MRFRFADSFPSYRCGCTFSHLILNFTVPAETHRRVGMDMHLSASDRRLQPTLRLDISYMMRWYMYTHYNLRIQKRRCTLLSKCTTVGNWWTIASGAFLYFPDLDWILLSTPTVTCRVAEEGQSLQNDHVAETKSSTCQASQPGGIHMNVLLQYCFLMASESWRWSSRWNYSAVDKSTYTYLEVPLLSLWGAVHGALPTSKGIHTIFPCLSKGCRSVTYCPKHDKIHGGTPSRQFSIYFSHLTP